MFKFQITASNLWAPQNEGIFSDLVLLNIVKNFDSNCVPLMTLHQTKLRKQCVSACADGSEIAWLIITIEREISILIGSSSLVVSQ